MALPADVKYGWIADRVLLGIMDRPVDPDDLPDAVPAKGVVTLTPTQPVMSAGDGKVTVLKEPYVLHIHQGEDEPETTQVPPGETKDSLKGLLVNTLTGKVAPIPLIEGFWNVTYKLAAVPGISPGGTLSITNLHVTEEYTEAEPMWIRRFQGIVPGPNERFVVNEQVYTETLAARDAALAAAADAEEVGGAAGAAAGAAAVIPVKTMASAPALLAPRPRPKWLTTFQPSHGWVNPLGSGTVGADTTDYVIGTQSMVVTGNAALQKTGLGVNLTKDMLCLWVKAADLPENAVIYVYAGTSSLSSFRVWTVRRGTDQSPLFNQGDWAFITLPVEASAVTGTPDDTNMSLVRVRSLGGGTIKVNAVGTIARDSSPFPQGVVSITFDDGYSSVLLAAQRSMTPRGLRGTAYVIPSLLGDEQGRFMTEAQLRELHTIHGWDIEAHMLSSARNRPVEELRSAFGGVKQWLAQHGYGRGDHFAYAGGQHDANAVAIAREFFTTARTIANPTPETFPPAMPHQLRGLSGVGHSTSVATVQTQVDFARAGGYWLNLVFHRIVDGPTADGNDCTWTDFNTILDYLITSGVDIRPVSEVFGVGY